MQVCDWAKAVLKAKRLDEGLAAAQAKRLKDELVTGAMLFGFSADKLVGYGLKRGPADTLVDQLQASGGWAPPTAASGLQAGRDLLAELVRDMMGFVGFVPFLSDRNLTGSPPR